MTKRNRYREIVAYLVCGTVSMAVAWAAMLGTNALFFGSTAYPDGFQSAVLGAANWIAGMLSAYAMNRKIVFRSSAPARHEFAVYTASRIWTLLVDQLFRQAMRMAHIDLYITSIAASVLVTVLNYIVGKMFVFRKEQ